MEPDAPIHEQVRQQFTLLAPQPGSGLAMAIDRACSLVEDNERQNDMAWSNWLDDQRELEEAKDEINRLRQQLAGTPNPEEEAAHA